MSQTLEQMMNQLGQQARAASRVLARANTQAKNAALQAIHSALQAGQADVLAANAVDMQQGRDRNLDAALLDRLELTPARFDGMLEGLQQVIALIDDGDSLRHFKNGCKFSLPHCNCQWV